MQENSQEIQSPPKADRLIRLTYSDLDNFWYAKDKDSVAWEIYDRYDHPSESLSLPAMIDWLKKVRPIDYDLVPPVTRLQYWFFRKYLLSEVMNIEHCDNYFMADISDVIEDIEATVSGIRGLANKQGFVTTLLLNVNEMSMGKVQDKLTNVVGGLLSKLTTTVAENIEKQPQIKTAVPSNQNSFKFQTKIRVEDLRRFTQANSDSKRDEYVDEILVYTDIKSLAPAEAINKVQILLPTSTQAIDKVRFWFFIVYVYQDRWQLVDISPGLFDELQKNLRPVIPIIKLALLDIGHGFGQKEFLVECLNMVLCLSLTESYVIHLDDYLYYFLTQLLTQLKDGQKYFTVDNPPEIRIPELDVPKIATTIEDYAFIIAAVKEAEIIDKKATDQQSVNGVQWENGEGNVGSFCTTRGRVVKKKVAPSEKVLNAVQYIAERVHESNAEQVQQIIKTLQERIEPYKK